MKKLQITFIVIFICASCNFFKPDYLKLISGIDLNKIMQKEDVFLIDVHIPRQKHIKGTDLFIPYNEVEQFKDRLPTDKTMIIYLYCEGGPMGNAAARSLHQLGYQNLINLAGGASAWRKAGLPMQ